MHEQYFFPLRDTQRECFDFLRQRGIAKSTGDRIDTSYRVGVASSTIVLLEIFGENDACRHPLTS